MSVLIPCEGCGAEYVLPPELGVRRVTGSVVTVRCRQCGGSITAEGLELVLDLAQEQRPSVTAPPAPAEQYEAPLLESLAAAIVKGTHEDQVPPSAPPSSEGYEPVSSAEAFELAPPTLHAAKVGDESVKPANAALDGGIPDSAESRAATPGANGTSEVQQSEPDRTSEESSETIHDASNTEGDRDSFSVMPARTRSLPVAPRGPQDFTAALSGDAAASIEEIEPLPPSSGSPALAELTRRLDAEDSEQLGPDSTVTRLIGMSASPTLVFGSTAPPVSIDAEASPYGDEPQVEADQEPASTPPPAKQASQQTAPARSNAAVAWLVGLAALAGIGVATMMQRERVTQADLAAAESAAPVQESVQMPVETQPAPTDLVAPPAPLAPVSGDTSHQPSALQPAAAPGAPVPPTTKAQSAAVPAKQSLAVASKSAEPKAEPKDQPAPAASVAPAVSAVGEPATPPEPTLPPIDKEALQAAVAAAAQEAAACRQGDDPTGAAPAQITFAPSGRVTSATVQGPPFAGTATGGCIAAALRRAKVPAFSGSHVTVSKTIYIR